MTFEVSWFDHVAGKTRDLSFETPAAFLLFMEDVATSRVDCRFLTMNKTFASQAGSRYVPDI